MMKTVLKRVVTLAVCAVTVLCGVFACAGATNDYEIPQIDDMTLSMPDGMSAITRDSKSTDKYFSVFGIDYETTMKSFENGNIYLQGMDSMSSVILTVTMTKNENSENVANYAQLSSSELTNIRNNFLNSEEYKSCTPDQQEKVVWLVFDATAQSSDGNVKTFVANTVYDGMNINITMQRTEGDVTAVDYDTFSKIVSSVKFSDLPFSKGIIPYIIIGGGALIVILIILIIIFAIRIRKHKKAKKNNAILEELASKYKLGDKDGDYDIDNFDDEPKPEKRSKKKQRYAEEIEEEPAPEGRRYAPEVIADYDEPDNSDYDNSTSDNGYASDSEIDEIINSARAYKNELEREAYKNNYGYEENSTEDEKKKEPTAADTSKTESEKNDEIEKDNAETPEEYEDISSSSGPTLVIPEPEHDLFETSEPDDIDREDNADVEETEEVSEKKHPLEKKVDEYANLIFGSDDPDEETEEEVDDEELVRSKAKKNKFDSGYDFFEEAPKKSMGVIKSSDLRDAEDFDVIGEVEKKAETVKQKALEEEQNKENEGQPTDKKSAGEVLANVGENVGNALKGFAGGVKNFGVHCGYFCKNVSRMIKRKRAIAKRKKAEEERRERERQKAERARLRAERGESDGLVQVHSRTDRRPQQNRRPANRNKRR
nr:hypothetical protein [uncultured Ruminococcus sp.]